VVEQPFKIPFVAAVVLAANTQKTNTTAQILDRAGSAAQKHLEAGSWRDLKLLLRFLGCLQGLFEADGIFPLLEGLFEKAVALQTASSEDVSLPSNVESRYNEVLTLAGSRSRTRQNYPPDFALRLGFICNRSE
jgi:hypothetical protein